MNKNNLIICIQIIYRWVAYHFNLSTNDTGGNELMIIICALTNLFIIQQ